MKIEKNNLEAKIKSNFEILTGRALNKVRFTYYNEHYSMRLPSEDTVIGLVWHCTNGLFSKYIKQVPMLENLKNSKINFTIIEYHLMECIKSSNELNLENFIEELKLYNETISSIVKVTGR